MRWAMIVAEEPLLITSDHPVTAVHPSLEFKGVGDPAAYILFPISPTRILSFDHRLAEMRDQH